MKETILGVEYEVTKIGFGQYLECKDKATTVDINIPLTDAEGKFTGRFYEKLSDAVFTKALVQLIFKKDGKAININDAKQCPINHGKALSQRASEIMSEMDESKNSSGGQEKEEIVRQNGK